MGPDQRGLTGADWYQGLDSGLRTGVELRQAWEALQTRAGRMVDYLQEEEELEGGVQVPVEGVGEGSTDGSTRMIITAQMESLKLKVLVKSLEQQEDRKARPVWSWPNRDKLTTSWLLALPGPHTSLTNTIFQEGLAMVLCLPSPACRDRVGESIGGRKVDMFGDALRCKALAGDGWRTRHDRHKLEIMRMLGWCGVVATCEVTGLFAHLVPQEDRAREELHEPRQVMVPDFRLELPAATANGLITPGLHIAPGQKETRLAELKFYCGKDLYNREGRRQRRFVRAVDRRAGKLMGEYQEKAEKVDRLLGEEEGRGRVRRRLDQFGPLIGIVTGAFNEVSSDTMMLLDLMATSRVDKLARATGLSSPKQEVEKGRVQVELRVQLSISSLHAGPLSPNR